MGGFHSSCPLSENFHNQGGGWGGGVCWGGGWGGGGWVGGGGGGLVSILKRLWSNAVDSDSSGGKKHEGVAERGKRWIYVYLIGRVNQDA